MPQNAFAPRGICHLGFVSGVGRLTYHDPALIEIKGKITLGFPWLRPSTPRASRTKPPLSPVQLQQLLRPSSSV
ncbi:hypothetical protein KUCAC02_032036 [Chaenocephalus aceratus]|nr:hypothetical protein KUCAC02_032036 [Chaenocephalus aceratus]